MNKMPNNSNNLKLYIMTRRKLKRPKNTTEKIKNVSLKDDFYSFVNKKWINHIQIPKDSTNINNFANISNVINNQLKHIIKNSSDLNIHTIYQNSKWNDNEVENSLLLFLKQMEEIIEDDIYKFLAFLIINGFGNIISINTEQYIFNPKKRIIVIDAFSQTFPHYYYTDKKYKKYIEKYHHFLKEYFNIFQKSDISNIIEIESFLSSNMKNPAFLRKTENIYFLMTREECLKKCGFDWGKLLTHLNFDLPNKIVIRQPEYIKQMMIYFKNWNSDFFIPFWTCKILFSGTPFHSKLYNLNFIFQKQILGIKKNPSHSDRLLGNVKLFTNQQLDRLYVENYPNDKLFCKKIMDAAIIILVKRLEENSWLSKETIRRAIKKIKSIKVYISRKPKMDKILEVELSEIMFHNYINLNKALLKYNSKNLNQAVSSDTQYLGDMSSYEVNANYAPLNNCIFIPNGILQPPFITKNFIHSLAFLGIIICHELTHALDDEGCKYDEKGVYNNWWTKKDKEEYKKLEKNVLELFKHYSKNPTQTEELKMGENIADMSSMKIVEDILEYYLDKNNITDKDKYFKQFYTQYAKLYRTQNYKTYYELVKNDYHSYGKYRINCILANSRKFRECFGIDPNDKMYHKIIDIW